MIQEKLETIKEFQDKYPNSHIGGSIGLLIRGIDLQRDLRKSDLDITVDTEVEIGGDYTERSDHNDFDYAVQKDIGSGRYVKMDIRICPESQFEVINYEGVDYNVSKLKDILFWKSKYAKKGVQKHIDDLITIETCKRPKAVKRLLPF